MPERKKDCAVFIIP